MDMVRITCAGGLAFLAVWMAGASAAEVDATRTLTLAPGEARIERYDREIETIVVGNAEVVVASVARSDALVLTGLAEGATNAIVLAEDGDEIDRIALRVAAPGARVVLWHGLEREAHRCDRRCRPEEGAPASRPAPAAQAVAE